MTPQAKAIVNAGRQIAQQINGLTPRQKQRLAALVWECVIVAADIEGITTDVLNEQLEADPTLSDMLVTVEQRRLF